MSYPNPLLYAGPWDDWWAAWKAEASDPSLADGLDPDEAPAPQWHPANPGPQPHNQLGTLREQLHKVFGPAGAPEWAGGAALCPPETEEESEHRRRAAVVEVAWQFSEAAQLCPDLINTGVCISLLDALATRPTFARAVKRALDRADDRRTA